MDEDDTLNWGALPTEIKNKILRKATIENPTDLARVVALARANIKDAWVLGEMTGGATEEHLRIFSDQATRALFTMFADYHEWVRTVSFPTINTVFELCGPRELLALIEAARAAPLVANGEFRDFLVEAGDLGMGMSLGREGNLAMSFSILRGEYMLFAELTAVPGEFFITVTLRSLENVLDEEDATGGVNFLQTRLQQAGLLPANPEKIGEVRAYMNLAVLIGFMALLRRMDGDPDFRLVVDWSVLLLQRRIRSIKRLHKWKRRGARPAAEDYYNVLRCTFEERLDYAGDNPVRKFVPATRLEKNV